MRSAGRGTALQCPGPISLFLLLKKLPYSRGPCVTVGGCRAGCHGVTVPCGAVVEVLHGEILPQAKLTWGEDASKTALVVE